jgi:hypothetical protein
MTWPFIDWLDACSGDRGGGSPGTTRGLQP